MLQATQSAPLIRIAVAFGNTFNMRSIIPSFHRWFKHIATVLILLDILDTPINLFTVVNHYTNSVEVK